MTPTAAARPSASFTERIGACVFFPRRQARLVLSGGPGGLRDAALLCGARVVAGDLRHLGRGLMQALDEGPEGLLVPLGDAARVAMPDFMLVALSSIGLGLCLGQDERRLRLGMVMDLCAQAYIGWLFVHVLASLGLTLLHHEPGALLRHLIQGAALLLFGIGWLSALLEARRAASALRGTPDPQVQGAQETAGTHA